MPGFQIHKERLQNGVAFIGVKGFLDAHTYEDFERAVSELFSLNMYRVIVDLSQLEYISSAGAGVFIGAVGRAQENNGDIIILNPSSNVREVFDLLGLSQIFTFKNTREEALKSFK